MIWTKIKKLFSDFELKDDKIIVKSNFLKTIDLIKNDFKFDILKNITAVDKQTDGIELIYHFYSTTDEEDALISITVDTSIESISNLYDSAIADEKEIFDLFGINFIGNNEQKRIYLPEGWIGHPLKKDYVENDERLKWND